MTAPSEAEFAAAVVDPSRPVPAGVVARTPEAAASRFAVYRNTVAVSLVEALAGRFPTVARLVGDDFFRAMARAYVAVRRPSSPLLIRYGDDFPDFVAGFPPAAGLAYLADVARLERAIGDAYHAADAVPLAPAALAPLATGGDWSARLVPHPAARLVRSPHPVGAIWQAHRSDPPGPLAARGPQSCLVVRPDMDVRVLALPPADARFVAALLDGRSLYAAATAVLSDTPGFDAGAALAGAVGAGAFLAVHFIEETSP